jgi:AraC-like DNA-binding protein
MDMVTWLPPAPLRPFVERYVGYRQEGCDAGTHRGLPSRHLTLIFSLGPPVDVAGMPDPSQPAASFDALAAGLHASHATIVHDGTQYGIHLDLTPLGARAWLGLPAGELAFSVVALDTLLGRRGTLLGEQLRAAATWRERFATLDGALVGITDRVREPSPEVGWAWTRVKESGGIIDVGTLASEVGWSRRHLGERFRREVGLSPKVAARVVRFEKSRRLLEETPRPGLASIAATCGFYDQAHLTREWHQFAGCTPTEWMAEELPSVQDDAGVSGAP